MAKKAARRNGGRTSRTKSQQRKQKRLQHFNFEPKLAQRVNIEGWDEKKTLRANYKNLGIAFDSNAILSKPNQACQDSAHQLIPEKTGILTERLEYLQSLPPPEPYEVKSMNVQEQYQLQRLIAAHADDYEAMQADLKLNINQMTANKLQKRIELMFRLQQITSLPRKPTTSTNTNDGDENLDEMEDEDSEQERDMDVEAMVPQVDTQGLDEDEADRAIKDRQRKINRIRTIHHNREVNQRFRTGLKKGSSIVVPRLTQLIDTRNKQPKNNE